jgi:methionine-rich copper-binding protein CopC
VTPYGRQLPNRLVAAALLAVSAGVVLAGVAPPLPAAAHDRLLSSDPAAGATLAVPPDVVTLTYSADVADEFAQAAVTPPGGDPVPLPAEALTASGPDLSLDLAGVTPGARQGTWAVVVRIVSVDGHPVEEEIRFEAGPAPAAASVTGGSRASTPSAASGPASSPAVTPAPEVSPASPDARTGDWQAAGGPLALVAGAVAAAGLVAGLVLAVRRR